MEIYIYIYIYISSSTVDKEHKSLRRGQLDRATWRAEVVSVDDLIDRVNQPMTEEDWRGDEIFWLIILA